jgi:serine/threonine-protein kinase
LGRRREYERLHGTFFPLVVSSDAMVGEAVGEYRIVRELGRGRAGVVYLAEGPRPARPVTIKLVRPGQGAQAQEFRSRVERFLADAQTASALGHAGIPAVLARGFTPGGHGYLVTEHLEGTTLRGWLAGSVASDLAARLKVARQVAAAAAAAHDRGIVHGALRPENVFLLGGSPGAVKVTDFGLGWVLDGQTPEDLAYAPPERCRQPELVDAGGDVYSFGCLLYEMVCGKPPFPYQDRDALVAAHLGEPPPPPRSLDPSVPAGLERLILAALCKAPTGRPRSLRAMEGELGQISSTGAPAGAGGWPATREEAVSPRLTPLGHVHLRPRELRTSPRPAPAEAPARRTPLGQVHLSARGPIVGDAPAEEPAGLEAEAAAAAAEERSAPRLWWLVAALVVIAGTVLAVRGLRSSAADRPPASTAPVSR